MSDRCDCGEARAGIVYRTGCRRCEARLIADTPARIRAGILASAPDELRALVEEELAADAQASGELFGGEAA